jgi:hypothetical protein
MQLPVLQPLHRDKEGVEIKMQDGALEHEVWVLG